MGRISILLFLLIFSMNTYGNPTDYEKGYLMGLQMTVQSLPLNYQFRNISYTELLKFFRFMNSNIRELKNGIKIGSNDAFISTLQSPLNDISETLKLSPEEPTRTDPDALIKSLKDQHSNYQDAINKIVAL